MTMPGPVPSRGRRRRAGDRQVQPRARRLARTAESSLPEDVVCIVPVRNVVLFPGIVMPLSLGRPKSIAAAQEAARSERPLGVLLQRVRRGRRPRARAALRGRLPRRHPALRHRPGRQPPHRLPGPAALSRARVRARPSVPRGADRAHRRAGRRRRRRSRPAWSRSRSGRWRRCSCCRRCRPS